MKFKAGDRVEVISNHRCDGAPAGNWVPAIVRSAAFHWYMVEFPGQSGTFGRYPTEVRESTQAVPDPRDAVVEAALKFTDGRCDHPEVYAACAAYRESLKPKTCEPPDEFKGEEYHWLDEGSIGLVVMANWERGYWRFPGNADDLSPEVVAGRKFSWKSVAKPAVAWTNAEIDALLDVLSNRSTSFIQDHRDLGRMIGAGDKSLIQPAQQPSSESAVYGKAQDSGNISAKAA